MNFKHTLNASLVALLIASSGLAYASPDSEKSKDSTILKGPSVNITPSSKNRESRDSMQSMKEKQQNRPVGYRDYLLALRQMRNQDGSTSLSLTQEQQDEIKSIMQDHREAMKEFQLQHKDKIQAMRKANGSDDQSKKGSRKRSTIEQSDKESQDGKPRNKQGMQDAQNARAKLRELLANAPANEVAFARLKSILSAEQQTSIQGHIKQARERRAAGEDQPNRARLQERKDQAKDRGNRQAEDENDRPKRARIQHKDIDSDKTKQTAKQKTRKAKPNRSDKPQSKDD